MSNSTEELLDDLRSGMLSGNQKKSRVAGLKLNVKEKLNSAFM
jgi:hypothetical protein